MAGRHPPFARGFLLGAALLLAVVLIASHARSQTVKQDKNKGGPDEPKRLQPVPAPLLQFPPLDSKTPLAQLLPVPPKNATRAARLLIDDLAQVPEIQFQEPFQAKDVQEMKEQVAFQLHQIRFADEKKQDRFMEALLESRPDFKGLPIRLGQAARTPRERSVHYWLAVQGLRKERQLSNPEQFWINYQRQSIAQYEEEVKRDADSGPKLTSARVAALMQVLAVEPPVMRKELAKHLAGVNAVEATHALTHLVLFSDEEEVRQAALTALQVRREKDYTAILLGAFRYPWPAVAKRASEAMVKLERKDLVAKLVDLLDEPDPREPIPHKIDGKKAAVVRELVRINYHQDCLLCHAPADPKQVTANGDQNPLSKGFAPTDDGKSVPASVFRMNSESPGITAPISIPGQPLPNSSVTYQQNQPPEIFVRVDVTYLRPDFSKLMPVSDSGAWPGMQRFDFVVRTRILTMMEVSAFAKEKAKRPAGFVTPYQRAALFALRESTGRDAAPTSQAWREILKPSAPK